MRATYIGTRMNLNEQEGDVTYDLSMKSWLFRPDTERDWYRVSFDNLWFDSPEKDVADLKKKLKSWARPTTRLSNHSLAVGL